jgi:hypothetical protein
VRNLLIGFTACVAAASGVHAESAVDYVGPFTTQALYTMCSENDAGSRERCNLYLQGLLNGLETARSMQDHGMPVCLPKMTPEEARIRVLQLIDATTERNPSTNKDGGDWMAFMGIASGNLCKK